MAKKTAAKPQAKSPAKPKLLSGGNPQIPKGDGDAPVEDYLDAMPGWKQHVGRRLDELIVKDGDFADAPDMTGREDVVRGETSEGENS